MEKMCPHCKKKFLTHPAVMRQRYCGSADCQRARKRTWQKEKLASDRDYRENQAAAHRAWCKRNRDYWRDYRKSNPGYEEQRGRWCKSNLFFASVGIPGKEVGNRPLVTVRIKEGS